MRRTRARRGRHLIGGVSKAGRGCVGGEREGRGDGEGGRRGREEGDHALSEKGDGGDGVGTLQWCCLHWEGREASEGGDQNMSFS